MTTYLTLNDAAAAVRDGVVSSADLVKSSIAISDRVEPEVASFLTRFDAQALAAAEEADAAAARGEPLGPLHGIPIAVKDIITTVEAPTRAQSLILDPEWSSGDAVVVDRLRRAGAVIIGKTTTMEFAIGRPDRSKPFPIPRNPWNTDHWTGGSSSGSGSAVATGAALGALGTDTGGSIRVPAALCGVTGLKPSFGRVPKSGCVPLGFTLDHIGPIARSARDCAVLLRVLAGHHQSDPSSVDAPVPDYLDALTGDLSGLRIGVDMLSRFAGAAEDPVLPERFRAALNVLESRGAELVEIELPYYAEMATAVWVIGMSEALAHHSPDLRTRWEDYFVDTRLAVGAAVLYSGADYVQAQRARRVGQQAIAEIYREVDLIITPTSSAGALTVEDMIVDPSTGGFGPAHTPYWDSIGNPVITVPIGFTAAGLPLGMQIAGRPFDEETVLRTADAFQQQTDWHLQLPPIVR